MIKTVPKIIAAATGLVLAMGALVVMTGAREKHEERYNAYMTHFVNPVVEKYDLSNDTEPRSPYDYITVDNGSRIVGMLEFLVPKKYNDEFVVSFRGDLGADNNPRKRCRYKASNGREYFVELTCVVHEDGTRSYTYFMDYSASSQQLAFELQGTEFNYLDSNAEEIKVIDSIRPELDEIKKEFESEVFGLKKV